MLQHAKIVVQQHPPIDTFNNSISSFHDLNENVEQVSIDSNHRRFVMPHFRPPITLSHFSFSVWPNQTSIRRYLKLPNLWVALALAISCLGFQGQLVPVSAATRTVTSTANTGAGTLRQVIADAAPGDVIQFSLTYPATITLTSAITVSKDLQINGPGVSSLTLRGGGTDRIFVITAGILRINKMTIQNGYFKGEDASTSAPGTYSGLGGAVFIGSGAGLTVTDAVFSGNAVLGGNGGNAFYDNILGYVTGSGGGKGGAAYSSSDPGQPGDFGGGGGSGSGSDKAAGAGGFGGGGGGNTGAVGGAGGSYGGQGAGNPKSSFGMSAGGGGAGLGGAIFIDTGGALGLQTVAFNNNSAKGGAGGNAQVPNLGGGGGGGGAGLGSAVFNNGSLCVRTGVTFTGNTLEAGAAGTSSCGFSGCATGSQPGQAIDTSTGIFDNTNDHSCDVWYFPPTDITFTSSGLSENQPSGAVAGSLSSTDSDPGDTFTYSLVSGAGSTNNASFSISGANLVTTAVLDYETQSTFSVRVRTTDSHNKYFEKAISITILNANDPPTSLILSNTSINENLLVGSAVGNLTTTDLDSSMFNYSLQSGIVGCNGTDNASFSISTNTLQAAAVFDRETKNTYSICIRSTDNGSPAMSLDTAFTITVLDQNDAPTDLIVTPVDLYESQPSGSIAASLASTDQDVGDSFTYSLVAGTGDSGNSSFTISGSNLLTATTLDYETQSMYSLRIQTTDAGGLSFAKVVFITILDANDKPTLTSLSANRIAENQPAGTLIGAFVTGDVDSFAFTYALTTGDVSCDGTDNASFEIKTNALQSAVPLDYESKTSYKICVRTTDNHPTSPQSIDTSFTINAFNVNEAPTDITFASANLTENQPSGSTVGILSTSDPDAGSTFIYSLVSGAGDNDNASFSISGGNIRTTASFDYETKSSFSVRVRSSDEGSLWIEKAIIIDILNANEAPTDISLTPSSLDENQASGTTVGALTTTDIDSGDSFNYSLIAGTGDTDNSAFAISGSHLQSAFVGDYDTKSSYQIRIRSTDLGGLTTDKAFTISINRVASAPTNIIFTPAGLSENQPAGTIAGELSAADPNAGDTFTFSLVSGNGDTDNSLFRIVGTTLETTAMLDCATKSVYSVRIRAIDSDNLSYDKSISITIGNVDEAPTDITLSPSSLDEGRPLGTTVGALSSIDDDTGDTFTYTLVSGAGDTHNTSFSISDSSLITEVVFDYEAQSSYSIRVRSTDSHGLSLDKSLAITIANVNETPLLSQAIPDQTATAGSLFSYTFPADTFSDLDGDTLIYSAALNSGDPLPGWLIFNETTRTFSGTPTRVQTITIRVTASDGNGGSITDDFDVVTTGLSGNRAPVNSKPIPNASATIGVAFSHSFTEDTFEDYEHNSLGYLAALASGSPLPAWLSFNQATRTFSGTPSVGDEGLLVIKVTAFDGFGGEISASFDLGVEQNVAPSVASPISDQAAPAGQLWTFQIPAGAFVDPSDTLTFTASLSDGSPLPAWLSFDTSTRTFSGTPPIVSSTVIRVTASDGLPGHDVSDTFILSSWSIDTSTNLPPGITADVTQSPGSGPIPEPAGTARLNYTIDIQILYGSEILTNLTGNGVRICFNISSDDLQRVGGLRARLVIGTSHNGGNWTLLNTFLGSGVNEICAYANQFSYFDVFARNLTASSASELPETGFAPGAVTRLPGQPDNLTYSNAGNLWVEIPALDLRTAIVGVPLVDGKWDVSWLWNNVGWLEGSAFPGKPGNSALSGHVVDANGNAGIFSRVDSLKWGDRVIVHAFNQQLIYEVRSVDRWVKPGNTGIIEHETLPWLTLITCHGYQPKDNSYQWRTAIRAVLVETSVEK